MDLGSEWMKQSGEDLTMMAHLSKRQILAVGMHAMFQSFDKCRARSWLVEQVIRGSRSVYGKILDRLEEIMKTAIQAGTEKVEEGRLQRLWGRITGVFK